MKEKTIFQWQYYWHYKLQVKLNHKHPHEWAFYALWIYNSILIFSVFIILSKYISAIKQIITGDDSIFIISYLAITIAAYFMTKYIYGTESYRVTYCDEIDKKCTDFKFKWFVYIYIIFIIAFCVFSVNFAY